MAYPDKINALVDVTADETLAAGGHAARHNDVNEALEEVRDVLGGGQPITATDNTALEFRRDNVVDVIVHRASTNAGGPFLGFRKSRGTHASPAVVAENDILGTIGFQGYSAALGGRRQAAEIRGVVDGEPDTAGDTSDMPGRLEFRTTPDGSASRVERMRITNAGAVLIGTTTPGSAGAGDLVVNGGVFLGGSAAGNELDDYEEGTWTPTYEPTSGAFTSVTYDAATTGYYTKVGRVVYFTCALVTDELTLGTAAGTLRVGGLPFTNGIRPGVGNVASVTIGYVDDWASEHPTGAIIGEGLTEISLYYKTAADGASISSAPADLTTGSVNNHNDLYLSGFYFTA